MVLVARAINLQVMENRFSCKARARRGSCAKVAIPTVRGSVFDRNGEAAGGIDAQFESIWAHPGTLLQEVDNIPMLAGLLEMPAERA